MTKEEANCLVEGDRVISRELHGTVIGATKNCVSIQWDGREATEIFTTDDMRNVSKRGRRSNYDLRYARVPQIKSQSAPVTRATMFWQITQGCAPIVNTMSYPNSHCVLRARKLVSLLPDVPRIEAIEGMTTLPR